MLPAAIIMGLLSEALKYAYILALPWLNFQEVYGPFALSVSMMFWAFLSGLLLLAGANLSARRTSATRAVDHACGAKRKAACASRRPVRKFPLKADG